MIASQRLLTTVRLLAASALLLLALVAHPPRAQALGSTEPNQDQSVGLEARISAPAPTQAAVIGTPHNGQTFNSSPITVAGLCKTGLLVKVFSNNVFVGSTMCQGGSFSLKASLFSGKNDLVARVYDSLNQSGPDSNVVSVTFHDAKYAEFGSQLTLTTSYARRGANPGDVLSWPIVLSGGTGPYALSVDWGDSSGTDLKSETFAGTIDITHVYQTAGVYPVVVKATDHNGSASYLQLVAVANGEAVQKSPAGSTKKSDITVSPQWYWFLPVLPLLLVAFWLGGRNELYVIRKRLDQARGASQQ